MIFKKSPKQKLQNQSTHPRLIVKRDSRALIANYKTISQKAQGLQLIPMIKADAYGHGMGWVTRTLQHQKNLYGFGVATLEEGAFVREELNLKTKIIVFSGATPWTEEKGRFCQKFHLTPVIASDTDWKSFTKHGWHQKIPYDLKFNTGMNRLGLSFESHSSVIETLRGFQKKELPQTVLTHLALGENPSHSVSKEQLRKFTHLRSLFTPLSDCLQFHLANSAAIWNAKKWKLKELTQIVRPGLSLYGIPPWPKASSKGLTPVMSFYAQILKKHSLGAGEKLGYGATFSIKKNQRSQKIATLGLGYADGLHRLLSNQAEVWVKNKKVKILGTISMDLCAIECPNTAKEGDWVEILGPHTDLWKRASQAKTIPYELLTSISTSGLSRDRNRIDT